MTPEDIKTALDAIEKQLESNGLSQSRYAKPCPELTDLKLKALDALIKKSRLNFKLSNAGQGE